MEWLGLFASEKEYWNPTDRNEARKLLLGGLELAKETTGKRTAATVYFLQTLGHLEFKERNFSRSAEYFERCVDAASGSLEMYLFGSSRWAIGVPAAVADWRSAADEARRQHEELKIKDGYLLAMEAIFRHLLGDTNRVSDLQSELFEGVLRNPQYPFSADIDALLATLAMPLPAGREDLLRTMIERCILNQGSESWFQEQKSKESLSGMMAYRIGHYAEAIGLLDQLISELGSHNATLCPRFVLAMAHSKSQQRDEAIRVLNEGERMLDGLTRSGLLHPYPAGDDFPRWDYVSYAVALRDEAETAIYGQPKPRPAFSEELAPRRRQWEELERLKLHADQSARRRQFAKAKESYLKIENHPSFDLLGDPLIKYKFLTVFWALGDRDNHLRTLSEMHRGFSSNDTTHLYQLAELPWPLPPDLELRREGSAARQELEERGADLSKRFKEDYRASTDELILGMLAYREEDYEKALKHLAAPSQSTTLNLGIAGPAFAAMAHWKRDAAGDREEARRLLANADQLFNERIIKPGRGMYSPDFPSCIMPEMVIKEADREIDPGVVNAPHVAALPPEGWTP